MDPGALNGARLRRLRTEAGLTQGELAVRAGVSRQLVGAVEAGRHLPRVDAALGLASALGVEVAILFGSPSAPVDVASGAAVPDGRSVRAARVGDLLVTAPARLGHDGYDVADGVVEHGRVTELGQLAPGPVVAGCEPGLELVERLLREGGMAAVAVHASSGLAIRTVSAGRAHAAVVHAPAHRIASMVSGADVERIHVASWRVGLAAPPDSRPGWWSEALSGRVPVVQREAGAGVQRAFLEAVEAGTGPVAGPVVASHLESARRAVIAGMPAVTIEPAALAVGAPFHPLEVHTAELWCDRRWVGEPALQEVAAVIAGRRFQRRLEAVGGYDLAGCGSRVA